MSKKIKKLYTTITYILLFCVVTIIGYSSYLSDEPISVIHSNNSHTPLNFALNKTNDTISKMLIRERQNSCQVILKNGDTWFFAEPGDMILWLKEKNIGKNIYQWVYTVDTNRWIEVHLAWYGIRDKTVMGYGFAAREKRSKDSISYEEMRRRMLHGETLLNPRIRKHLLEDLYEK